MDASTTDKVGDDPNKPSAQAKADEKRTAPTVEIEDAPDPDEDDLDDLDDMLEEFSSAKLNSDGAAASSGPGIPSATTPSAPNPSLPATDAGSAFTAEGLEDLSEEEFEKQLQAGMAELMNNLENSTDMQSQFEDIFKGLGGSAPAASGSDSQSGNAPGSSAQAAAAAADLSQDATFQETIRRTMARMQESGDQATAAAAAEGSEDDFLAEMMKAMKDIPGNEGSEEDFSKMLMGMMEHLTNKEILYEPMKELNDKYPDWITGNKDTLSKDDLKRYQDQQVYVAEMVAKFEEPTYSDDHSADRQYIVERMQKMQEAGSPPHDLIGDMPSAKEVLDAPDESCAPQ